MIKLYDDALSGNCFKVRQLLAFPNVEYETSLIDFYPRFEHRGDVFLALNPLGQLPVIEDGDLVLRDAQAIMVHIASKHDTAKTWYPDGLFGPVQIWLAFADSLTGSISGMRLHDAMFFELPVEKLRKDGQRLLRVLDEHLWLQEQKGHDWLCDAPAPTLADLACFPYVALCEEAGISQLPYPAIVRWIERFMRLDGYSPMPGMMPLDVPKPEVGK